MRQILWFFALTFTFTWAGFFAAAALWDGASPAPLHGLPALVFFLGVFAPGLVAIGLTARFEGQPAVLALLRRLVQWEVSGRWYLFALAFTVTVKLTGAVAYRALTGEWPRFGDSPWYLLLAATIASTVVLGQAGEEIGWRGYALPRLAERMGLARASVLLGAIWAVWHLPLFYIPGLDTTGQSFPLYLLQVIALSVAIAWLYARVHGSLLLTMLMHAAINNTSEVVPAVPQTATNPFSLSPSLLGWLTAAVLWACAGYFLARMPAPSRANLGTAPLRH